MPVTNYKAIIESVAAKFADQLVALPGEVDNIGRRLLPHCIDAMPDPENWAVLEKRTSQPYNVPYDILVFRPTREHFDVWTSRAVSGNESTDKTGPRRLIATWGAVGVLPKATWHACDWRETQTPIVPLGTITTPPKPNDPPSPPLPPTSDLAQVRLAISRLVSEFERERAQTDERLIRLEAALANVKAAL